MHLIQSKVEQVEKDALKRKVSKMTLAKFMKKFKGGIFEYRLNGAVEEVVQKIIEWKAGDWGYQEWERQDEEGK